MNMENPPQGTFTGIAGSVVTIFSSVLSVFSLVNLHVAVAIVAGIVGIFTGIVTTRYYLLAHKEKKQQMEIDRQQIMINNKILNQ